MDIAIQVIVALIVIGVVCFAIGAVIGGWWPKK